MNLTDQDYRKVILSISDRLLGERKEFYKLFLLPLDEPKKISFPEITRHLIIDLFRIKNVEFEDQEIKQVSDYLYELDNVGFVKFI